MLSSWHLQRGEKLKLSSQYLSSVRRKLKLVSVQINIMTLCYRILFIINSQWGLFTTEVNENDHPPVSRHFFCTRDGFNITIPQNATVPPLNLDAVRIPSGQRRNCKPQQRSKDAVTFSFPFTDCGTQSMVNVNQLSPQLLDGSGGVFVSKYKRFGCVLQIAGGIITYWVNIEVKQNLQGGSIFHDTPFQ